MSTINRRAALTGLTAAGGALIAGGAQAGVIRAPGYPNLAIVTGVNPVGEYRPALKTAVAAGGAGSPVRRGSHDLWLSFPYPPQPELNPTPASFEHGEDDTGGRRLWGIGDMRRMPMGVGIDEMKGRIFTTVHEIAHAWTVHGIRVRMPDGTMADPMNDDEIMQALLNERPFLRPAFKARGPHWNAYINVISPMDALPWTRAPFETGYAQWTQTRSPSMRVAPPGLLGFDTDVAFGDLDLYMMGLKSAESCYPETGGRFYWMEPKLSRGPQMRFHTGLYLAFDRSRAFYFGFYNDHMVLKVENTVGAAPSRAVQLPSSYRPLANPNNAVMLRVVRQGSTYYFQACRGNSVATALGAAFGISGPGMFDGADTPGSLPGATDLGQWETVYTASLSGEPQAVGVFTKTWPWSPTLEAPILAEGRFFSFELRKNGVNQAYALQDVVSTMRPGAAYGTLPAAPMMDMPKAGAIFRQRDYSKIVGAPLTGTYDQWQTVDQAPKILTRAPMGDFAFGTTCKVNRSVLGPQSGGFAANLTMWGIERSARVADVEVPAWVRARWAAAPRSIKNAFMVVTQNADAIPASDLAKLDVLRQYYEAALPVMTRNLLFSDSRL